MVGGVVVVACGVVSVTDGVVGCNVGGVLVDGLSVDGGAEVGGGVVADDVGWALVVGTTTDDDGDGTVGNGTHGTHGTSGRPGAGGTPGPGGTSPAGGAPGVDAWLRCTVRRSGGSPINAAGSSGRGAVVRRLTRVGRPGASVRRPCSTGGSDSAPNVNTNASTPPSAATGSRTTAETHPRPLRGNSR